MTPPTRVVPGEFLCADAPVVILDHRPTVTLTVVNAGDRPIQVGSHYHFAETNPASSSTATPRVATASRSRRERRFGSNRGSRR